MRRKGLLCVSILCLCLFLGIQVDASNGIAIPGTTPGGDGDGFFSEPIYTAVDLADYVRATNAMLSLYDGISSVSSGEFASARLIVKSNRELPDLSEYHVSQILVDPDYDYLIQFTDPEDAEACAGYLLSLSYVSYAEADREREVDPPEETGTMASSTASNSWGVGSTKTGAYADDLRTRGVSSRVTVAVVDTGVDATHPFLKGRVISGYDLVDNDPDPKDGNGHGTHVSGTVVDCTPGLEIVVMPVRVLDNEGSGYDSVIGLGIQYAVDNGADVINMSLGGYGHSDFIDSKISYAVSKGVTVVVAAGNDNNDTSFYCPAHDTDCITVAAIDQDNKKAGFSNYGDAVDIAAPGVKIKSCTPGNNYKTWDGTSMAAPHVSAAAALLLYEDGSLTPGQVEKKLRDAALDLGTSGWDRYYGAGALDMGRFIRGGGNDDDDGGDDDKGFSDVPKDAYYYKAVMWALENGITTGTTQRTFSPNDTCTTAQILTFMWRASGSPKPSSTVTSSAYYGNAMAWARENGISSDQISASAGEACTRAAAMTYMWQDDGKPSAGRNPFIDVPNNSYYAQAVCWAVDVGITNGTTATTFSPNNPCTRAQIMTFLYRYHVESVS